MRFASLGSGSRGNATLVQYRDTMVLIDCGFSVKETELRLARMEVSASAITAILVTHEHGDHISGVGALARKYGLPVWLTAGTGASGALGKVGTIQHFSCHENFCIADLEIRPFPVPHDCREPSQFVLSSGIHRLGILTDTGKITPHMIEQLDGCDALFLECNHDPLMLENGPYPSYLKARVGGDLGHLSNQQAASLLNRIDISDLQHLVAAHISDKNNTPELARQALSAKLDCEPDWIAVAYQDQGLDWRNIC